MSVFLKGVGLGMAGIVLLLCGLIALYYFESKAALRADIKAVPRLRLVRQLMPSFRTYS